MKPVATFCGAVIGARVSCLWRGPVASAREKEAPKKPGAPHASLIAYPEAIIWLKDPKTGMVFYVESNGRRLVAFGKDGAVAWSVDVLDEAKIEPESATAGRRRRSSAGCGCRGASCGPPVARATRRR
jgi:hypothetical protein